MKTTALLLVSCLSAALALPLAAQSKNATPAATPVASIPPDSPKYGVYPIAYREIITEWLKDRLLDVSTAKLEFEEPKAGDITQKRVRASGYTVDFRVNSKNKFGMYTGFQKHRVLIRNGEIIWADRVRG